jgi:hypothetical protein
MVASFIGVEHHFQQYVSKLANMSYVIPDTLLKVSLNTNKTGHHVIRYTWHIVLVWFFLLILLSEACPDNNFFVFPDRSVIFGLIVLYICRTFKMTLPKFIQ